MNLETLLGLGDPEAGFRDALRLESELRHARTNAVTSPRNHLGRRRFWQDDLDVSRALFEELRLDAIATYADDSRPNVCLYLARMGSGGDGNGEFTNPLGLDADVAGNVYVADEGNARIQKFYLGPTACTKVDRHHIGPCTSAQKACLQGLVPTAEVKCIAQVTAKFKRYRTK